MATRWLAKSHVSARCRDDLQLVSREGDVIHLDDDNERLLNEGYEVNVGDVVYMYTKTSGTAGRQPEWVVYGCVGSDGVCRIPTDTVSYEVEALTVDKQRRHILCLSDNDGDMVLVEGDAALIVVKHFNPNIGDIVYLWENEGTVFAVKLDRKGNYEVPR